MKSLCPLFITAACIAVSTNSYAARWHQTVTMNGHAITNCSVVQTTTGLFVFVPMASNAMPVPYWQVTNLLAQVGGVSGSFVQTSGDTMSGPLAINSSLFVDGVSFFGTNVTIQNLLNMLDNEIVNLAITSNGSSAVNYTMLTNLLAQVGGEPGNFVQVSGDNMTGVLGMGNNQITNLADATRGDMAVNYKQMTNALGQIAQPNGIGMRAHSISNQSIPVFAWSKVVFQQKVYDTVSEYDTNTFRFTAKSGEGLYKVHGAVRYMSGTQGDVREIAIHRNGNATTYGTSLTVSGPGNRSIVVYDELYLYSNDYVEIWTYQDGNVSLDILGGSSNTYFAVRKVN